MFKKNPAVLLKNHLKIYVLLKDKIIFEMELEKQNIEYYCDIEKQPTLENGIRYFVLDEDRIKIDEIFIKHGIIASTETIGVSDYRDGKKLMSIYFKFLAIAVAIMIIIILVERFQNLLEIAK